MAAPAEPGLRPRRAIEELVGEDPDLAKKIDAMMMGGSGKTDTTEIAHKQAVLDGVERLAGAHTMDKADVMGIVGAIAHKERTSRGLGKRHQKSIERSVVGVMEGDPETMGAAIAMYRKSNETGASFSDLYSEGRRVSVEVATDEALGEKYRVEEIGGKRWKKSRYYNKEDEPEMELGYNLDAEGNMAGRWRKDFEYNVDDQMIGEEGVNFTPDGKIIDRWEKEFTYNEKGQMDSETGINRDAEGNVTGGWVKTFGYDEQGQLVTEKGDKLDADGGLIKKWEKRFGYNEQGHMATEEGMNYDAEKQPTDGWRKKFKINDAGRIIGETGEVLDATGKPTDQTWEK